VAHLRDATRPVTVQRMDHVGVVVEDLDAAIEFFVALGLEQGGRGTVGGDLVDRIVGLDGVTSDFAFMQTPDGHGRLELIRFQSPPLNEGDAQAAANTPGLRHLTFAVDDIEATVARLQALGAELVGEVVRYESSYILCYIRGPEGIIVELAEKLP
jgi:catechol 2,3-dioxygenase-like lactoylglutathione lyase family enzyme